MTIIRTAIVEISSIPAIAYKQKLASGGAGLKIIRLDQNAAAIFTLDKKRELPIPLGDINRSLFPDTAVDEALDMTSGLPYSAREKIKISEFDIPAEKEDVLQTPSLVGSDEYTAIVERYADEKCKMNYILMNKDFIRFAGKSKTVAKMVAENALEEDILVFIVKSRATLLSGKKESLSDKDVKALIETLDEIDPRSAFKELKVYIRRLLAHH